MKFIGDIKKEYKTPHKEFVDSVIASFDSKLTKEDLNIIHDIVNEK